MNNLNHHLVEFFMGVAPPTLRKLSPEFPPLSPPYNGKRVHYLFRLCLEGRDILERGDSLLKTFDFDYKTLGAVWDGANIILKSLGKNEFDEEAARLCKTLPEHMLKIASYHDQKVAASKTKIEEVKKTIVQKQEELNQARANKDIEKLFEFFCDQSSMIDECGETGLHATQGKVCNLNVVRARKNVMRFLEEENGRLGLWFGHPQSIRALSEDHSLLTGDVKRNDCVLKDVRDYAQALEGLFTPSQKPNRRNFIRLIR